MPLIKSRSKAIGKQALKGGFGFASDVLAGKDAKKAAVEREKMADSSLLRQAAGRKCKAPARVQKKPRKQMNNIFSWDGFLDTFQFFRVCEQSIGSILSAANSHQFRRWFFDRVQTHFCFNLRWLGGVWYCC